SVAFASCPPERARSARSSLRDSSAVESRPSTKWRRSAFAASSRSRSPTSTVAGIVPPTHAVAFRAVQYVNLGRTGLRVARICLGMMSYGSHEERAWALDEDGAEPIVRRAVESGVIFFDTADVYNGGQSETVTGRLLQKLFGTRDEYVVATKVHGRTMPGENGAGLSRK